MPEQPIPPQFAEPAQYWPPGSSEAELVATLEAAGYHIDRRVRQADRMIGTRPHCAVTHAVSWTMRDEHRIETVTSSRSDICRG